MTALAKFMVFLAIGFFIGTVFMSGQMYGKEQMKQRIIQRSNGLSYGAVQSGNYYCTKPGE